MHEQEEEASLNFTAGMLTRHLENNSSQFFVIN